MENKYFVNFGTGAGNEYVDTLEEAKKFAEERLAYTQADVRIYKGEEEVARLPWWGVAPGEDDYVTESFGDFGFFGEWVEI